ncbi:MAG: cyclic nucleotide-binding domain-containing protein [Deltaproteobacteria bacterium]|nr:cyclic nucleotide-binding domain-containing protein [Deltaproteobacteria bacterium]MBW2658913.1 cyclic nucleotide-binding domain-containing protein [Deltaproteobacteria bacterium]
MSSFTEENEQIPEMQKNLELLKGLPFFAPFPVQALKILALLATRTKFMPGDLLYEKGDDPHRAYLVLHGILALTAKENNNSPVTLRIFREGEFLGSLALLGRMPALFNLTAEMETSVLTLSRDQFSKVLSQFPEALTLSLTAALKEINRWEKANIPEAEPCCLARLGVTAL